MLELGTSWGYWVQPFYDVKCRSTWKGPLVPALWLSLSPEEDTLAATDNVLMAFVFGIQKGRFPLTISMRACTKENPQRER